MTSLFQSLQSRPRRLYAWLVAWFWTARGRRALRRGETALGVKALEQAVSWRPEAFKPQLFLAGAYLRAAETWRAHRALAQARESDPARFARLAPGLLAGEGVDPDTLGRILVFASPSPRPGIKVPTAALAGRSILRSVGPAHHPYGDCRDLDEYARFQAMPPISQGEIDAIDWDHILEDLLGD